jgi:hypothetical protein
MSEREQETPLRQSCGGAIDPRVPRVQLGGNLLPGIGEQITIFSPMMALQ